MSIRFLGKAPRCKFNSIYVLMETNHEYLLILILNFHHKRNYDHYRSIIDSILYTTEVTTHNERVTLPPMT